MATSSTSTATSVEQTTSDCDEIESSDGPSSNVQTFLNKLHAPRQSELTRKRKVRVTSSGYRKKKPACSTDPTSVSPTHRARNFPHECLIVSVGKLFCSACREELSRIVKAHVECSKHKCSKEAIGQKYLSILKETQA